MTDFIMRLIGRDETKAATDSAAGNLSQLDNVAGKVKDSLAGLAAGLTVGAFAGMVKGSIDAGVRLTELSARIGVGIVALSQYKYVAEANSISLETLSGAFQKMQISVSKSASGTGAAAEALDQLGLSTSALQKLAPDQQFEAIAEALSQVGNKGDQAKLAMALFGKAGTQLLPIMEEGRAGLLEMREEADRLGLTISEVAGKQLSEFDDAMDRIGGRMEGVKNTIAIGLLPALNDIAKALEDTNSKSDSFRIVAEGLGDTMKVLTFATMAAFEAIVSVGKAMGAVEAAKDLAYSGKFAEAQNVFINFAADERASIDKLTEAYEDLFDTKKDGFYGETSGKIDRSKPTPAGTQDSSGGDATAKAIAEQRKLNDERLKADQEYLEQQAALELQKFQKEEELSQARIERAQGEATRIFEATRTPMEQFQADYEALYELYQKGFFEKLGGEETFLRYAQELNNKRLQSEMTTLTQAQKWERMTLQERAKFSFNTFADVFHAFSGNSKKMFEVSKALSIVQTTMNTYDAAMGAYKALAGIPIVGPALGAAAAAAAIGFGMAQVSAIKGQSFGGGNGVSAVSIPAVPSSAPGSYTGPNDYGGGNGQGGQAAQPPKTIYINIEGGDSAQLSGAQVRTLIEAINEEIKTGNMRIQS